MKAYRPTGLPASSRKTSTISSTGTSDPVLVPVFLDQSLVLAGCEDVGMIPPRQVPRLFRRQVQDGHSQEFVGRIAHQLTERMVGADEPLLDIDDCEGLRTGLEQPDQPARLEQSRVARTCLARLGPSEFALRFAGKGIRASWQTDRVVLEEEFTKASNRAIKLGLSLCWITL